MLEYTDPDIILASETWLYPGITEREILPDNYRFVARKDRKSDPHGGVAIIANAEFDAVEIELTTKTEFVSSAETCPTVLNTSRTPATRHSSGPNWNMQQLFGTRTRTST